MNLAKLIPALISGTPISLVLAGWLVLAGLDGKLAVAIGYVVGTALARAFLMWIQKPAPQRS